MLTQDQLPINSIVSFELYPAQILGVGFNNAKVLGIFDAETARTWLDTVALHAQVFQFLPSGTPNHHDGYPYVRLQLLSGEKTVVGLPWIKDNSLVIANSHRLQITLDNVRNDDLPRIQAALSANGFRTFSTQWL